MICWVLNAGSSSLKFQLIDTRSEQRRMHGMVERIGTDSATLTIEGVPHDLSEGSLSCALETVRQHLPEVPQACVHRIVHGADQFIAPTHLDSQVLDTLRGLVPLAPLHLPANIAGVEAALTAFPEVPHIGVFDTAFHATLPPAAQHYAIPKAWSLAGARRYGFHGTSHRWIATESSRYIGQPLSMLNIVSIHLGNGASMTAIRGGQAVDTTMGLTPLEGLVMGTRCGDLDPGIPGFVAKHFGLSHAQVEHMLWHESGLRGLCGLHDMRDVLAASDAGNADATLAHEVFCHRAKRHLGAMMAVLGETHAVVFTGGIGEHSAATRARILESLQGLGIELDPVANAACDGGIHPIHRFGSRVKLLVIPTQEELQMAREAQALLTGGPSGEGRPA